VCRGAGLVIVEVREEVKMQQKPNKQKQKKTRQGCRVITNGGVRRKEMINMEVYEIKKSGACGSGGACSEHKTQAQNKININRGARLSIVEVYEVKTGCRD